MDARVKTYDDKMQKALDFLLSEYQTVRAGRANPHVLDKIKVDTMEHRHRSSRLAISRFQRRG